ncbi:MAG TPA: NAD(P)/FAD-dependent oxidoreductase [Ktedonobacteraceae bacterium]|nr:NAD(P)/FAD-dependent oxidoreductase [Ktedonobacteraceae bacterium]
METYNRALDILIIGAGQAGLALGYHLKTTPLRFQLVESHRRIGDSWRKRYDSLALFTPRSYSALPGLAVPGDPEGYPTKDEIADYLETYAAHFELPVMLETHIQSLEQTNDGFRATTGAGETIDCRAIVLATGAYQQPALPPSSQQLSADVLQLSPQTYTSPAQLPAGQVVIVGDGATGRQIARELAAKHHVFLATGSPRRVSPERILGKSLFWWLDKLGIIRASRESAIGKYLMKVDPFPGKGLAFKQLGRQGVVVVGRLTQANGKNVAFASGETVAADTVIWATGYKENADWVAIPQAKDAQGKLLHQRGISPIPRLYMIGKNWQWTRGSALLSGVGDDASYLTKHILHHLEQDDTSIDATKDEVEV